ncbi:Protein FraH [Planktothrix serta PCC 8927]|uniref:Protein FraH n=1 Tax=Planktothrix serta PCC 8927 TaxID=671068 RepID=A0A7Z9E4B3_9CYAN|nr:FHA domain-containing protein [Planktothrix serta]VXD25956.1 Protein FraH [Planktothrix serta PCC 8927]
MVVCPNCNYQNPEGATQCEACYTPLPSMTSCPHCGATIQTDASFCGQCGSNLQPASAETNPDGIEAMIPTQVSAPSEPLAEATPQPVASSGLNLEKSPLAEVPPPAMETTPPVVPVVPVVPVATVGEAQPNISPGSQNSATQLQQQTARLLHVQTNASLELPQNVSVIHLGKPNDLVPPDIDVSGFPNSEIVSRTHADIRIEGDAYYIEDVGSSNGTYINNISLTKGNRHRLRPGDRISLGKGDLVSFIFQLS